jgi:hypothetical protein
MDSSQGRSRLRPRSLQADIRDRLTHGQSRRSTTFTSVGVMATVGPPQHAGSLGLRRGGLSPRGGRGFNSHGSSLHSFHGLGWSPLSTISLPSLSNGTPRTTSTGVVECMRGAMVDVGSSDVGNSQCIPETQSGDDVDCGQGSGDGHPLLPADQRSQPPPAPQVLHARPSLPRRSVAWSDSALQAVLEAVDAGESIRSTSRCFGIPPTSLRDHIYGRSIGRKRGRQGVLTAAEELELVEYILKMQDLGWPMTIGLLRLKVAEICQDRSNPFIDGIPGQGWLRWFRRRHLELSLRASQGLEVNRARNLCPQNVASLLGNLQILYAEHSYPPDHIWNCDESGAQAGRNGGGTLVFARKGSKLVHSIIPDQREWLSVLACVNATGGYIPHFYIFKGKRMRRNYIARYEPGATMAMQAKA